MCPAKLCKMSQFTFSRHRVPNKPKQVQTRGTCGCSMSQSRNLWVFAFPCAKPPAPLGVLCKCVQMCCANVLCKCVVQMCANVLCKSVQMFCANVCKCLQMCCANVCKSVQICANVLCKSVQMCAKPSNSLSSDPGCRPQ